MKLLLLKAIAATVVKWLKAIAATVVKWLKAIAAAVVNYLLHRHRIYTVVGQAKQVRHPL